LHKRLLIIVVTAVLAVVLAAPAAAVMVSVRVEGKTQTLFGPKEPNLQADSTALDALVAAANRGEIYYHVTTSSLGSYVDQIGLFPAISSGGWMYKVNGALPPVGADKVTLKDGDRVLWYWANFDPATFAGPKTLLLAPSKLTRAERARVKRTHRKRYCYAVVGQDDKGVATPAIGAVLRVGSSRVVRTKKGRACLGRHSGLLVRASLSGAVRSNALK
jgi:hypothetical protein